MCSEEIEVEYLVSPVKSENDHKEYRSLKLKNGLTALLISDIKLNECTKDSLTHNVTDSKKIDPVASEEDDVVSCALCISVGSFDDPTETQGMAHLLEHVTCAGAEKFFGRTNDRLFAETGKERTVYAFQVHSCRLPSAIDRFAGLLSGSSAVDDSVVLKERENIDNEFYLDLPSDRERVKQLFRVTMSDENPSAKFSCGNSVTLRDEISDGDLCSKFKEFKAKYYSAHRMTLAVQAKLPLHTLEEYVKQSFSDLPSNFLPPDDTSLLEKNLFDTTKFRKIYKMKSVECASQMELKWVMPPSRHLHRSKPLNYISRVMSHEGRGSLSHCLRRKNLCIGLNVACEQTSIYSVFKLNLGLTPNGEKNVREILDAVFSFVKIMQTGAPRRSIFDEMQKSADDRFRFAEEVNPTKNMQNLCRSMQLHPPADYITGADLCPEYNADAIKLFADHLSCDNVFILLLSENFDEDEFDQVEPWYRIRYSSEEICENWLEGWKIAEPFAEFRLPGANPFVATDFNLVELPGGDSGEVESSPRKILDDDEIEIWYKADQKCLLPICFVYVHLIAAFPLRTIHSCAMLRLFSVIIHELVLVHLYDAKCAGLNCDISESREGIIVKVDGFSQKVPVLLKILMKYIGECPALITEHLFDLMKTELLKYYSSVLLDPVALASEIQSTILEPNHQTSKKNIDALNRINFPQFLDFLVAFVNKVHVRSLVQGNLTEAEAVKHVQESVGPLKCSPLAPKKCEVCNYELPPGDKLCRVKNLNPRDPNSVVLNFYQTDVNYYATGSPIVKQFLEVIMQEQLFRRLRVEEQLSYSVSCFGSPGGFLIMLISPIFKFTTEQIDGRIDNFLRRFVNGLKEMSVEEFDERREHFVRCLKKCDECLKDEVDRNWSAIDGGFVLQDYEQQISTLSNLTVEQFRKWLDGSFMNDIKAFGKLSVQVVGNSLSEINKF